MLAKRKFVIVVVASALILPFVIGALVAPLLAGPKGVTAATSAMQMATNPCPDWHNTEEVVLDSRSEQGTRWNFQPNHMTAGEYYVTVFSPTSGADYSGYTWRNNVGQNTSSYRVHGANFNVVNTKPLVFAQDTNAVTAPLGGQRLANADYVFGGVPVDVPPGNPSTAPAQAAGNARYLTNRVNLATNSYLTFVAESIKGIPQGFASDSGNVHIYICPVAQVAITCSTNAQCGSNGYVNSPTCNNGNVFQDFKTYTCNNPGTANSSCNSSTVSQQKTVCGANQTCSGGSCVNQNVTCSTNSQCGTDGYINSPTCNNGNVFQDFKTYTCNNPGAANSSCSSNTVSQQKTVCGANQTCNNGSCTNQNISCSSNSQCGTDGYINSPTCNNGNVFQDYKTYTCNNPGATNSSCSNSTVSQQKTVCGANQTCSSGSCINNVTPVCTVNADCGTNGLTGSPTCNGNSVYQNYRTFTCNNGGTASATCTHTDANQSQNTCSANQVCSGGSCVATACNTNADCGTNGLVGSPTCNGNSVFQNYRTFTCTNPGMANSSCSSNITSQFQNNCTGNQTCNAGSCTTNPTLTASCTASPASANVNQSVTFTAQPAGGTGTYAYSWTQACNGFGQSCTNTFAFGGTQTAYLTVTSGSQTVNTSCFTTINNNNNNCTGTASQICQGNSVYNQDSCGNRTFVQNCSNNNQTCSNGSCINNNNNCTNNSYQQCKNGSVHWFDSCGGDQGISQACNGNQTCSGNVCVNQNICTSNSYQQCLSGSVHWFNSCGQDQGISQYCSNGCSGNTCNNNNNNNTCTSNSYQQCLSGSVHWFNSCGQDQGISQYCSNGCSGNTCNNQNQNQSGALNIVETVRNLSSGNVNYSSSVSATLGDILQYSVSITSNNNQYINNITLRDTLPSNLIYNNNLTVDGILTAGNISSGVTIGSMNAGQTRTVSWQVQVAGAGNFPYGTTTLTDSTTVSSTDSNITPSTTSSQVVVNRSGVLGATSVSTGLTDNILFDSFFIPLLLALIGGWLYLSGYLGKKNKGLASKNQLDAKISHIRQDEVIG